MVGGPVVGTAGPVGPARKVASVRISVVPTTARTRSLWGPGATLTGKVKGARSTLPTYWPSTTNFAEVAPATSTLSTKDTGVVAALS